MSNPAFDSIIQAYTLSSDARLLVSALDLADGADERTQVLTHADTADLAALDDDARIRIANAALEADRFPLAARTAQGIEAALATEVTALLRGGSLAEAEARYHAAIAANPALEEPELLAELERAKASGEGDAPSNVLVFNTRQASGSGAANDEHDEAHARAAFQEPTGVTSTIGFDDVGGHDAVKRQIDRRIVAPFRKPALFARFRRKAGGGVLMYGPPGCGKTLLARATAGECKARFINVPVTDVLDKYIGEPERKLAAIFADARRDTPTVLFFDEIEALAAKRGQNSSQHEVGIVSTFLAEMDGFAQDNDGVLILAATNMPWAVDPAFRRSGRFDRSLFVPPPDKAARAEILRIHLADRPVDDALDTKPIMERTSGFSGADIQNLIDTAADFAIEESVDQGREVPINAAHFTEALDEVKATTSEWLTTARNFTKYGNSGGQYDEVADFLKKHGR